MSQAGRHPKVVAGTSKTAIGDHLGLPHASSRPLAAWVAGLPGAGLLDRFEQYRWRRRVPFKLDDVDSWSLQRHGPWLELARVSAGVTGRRAATQNLDLVIELCDALDIRYSAIPEPNAMSFRLVIEDERWRDFVAALRRRGEREPVYVVVDAVNRRGAVRRWADLTVTPRISAALETQKSVDVFRPVTPARGVAPFGRGWACVVERWSRDEFGRLRAPTRNARAEFVAESLVTAAVTTQADRTLPTIDLFTRRHVFEVDFPVDAVYLWVDGNDPAWRDRKKATIEAAGRTWAEPDAITDARFREGGELRYSLRSLNQFAPWIRQVYLVTDRQVPNWLDTSQPGITVVDHQQLFGEHGRLPTFNSHAIGARLHHIAGLAEHYLYFNDDVFLGTDVAPSLFFNSNGVSKFFVSRTSLGFADERRRLSHETARRNVADLLARDFGRTPSNAFYHSPIPQRRSTMFELEERYPAEFASTWNNQFRSYTDIEPNSWLHNYYGYLTGRATPGEIRYTYFQIGDPETPARLRQLFTSRDRDTFCINDHPDASPEQFAFAGNWLARYFPEPGNFEKVAP